ncbi:Hsp70 family protein [Altererythrobacter sp. KTW20L]|uniref:Hsp70 family protein n=1 Tax=Altererythrobacter sp. KTW20L TaxID=2942210 RepID=UPI0020BD48B3|nr:Hsp70 family protein [Altererythrobacter sp. KTW20L]
MQYVGIDLGTTNSAIASFDGERLVLYKSPEQHDVTPSALFFDKRGNRFVGSRAYDNWARNPDNGATLFKRMMGTSTPIKIRALERAMTPEECSAEILRTVFAYLPEDIRQSDEMGTVITVPAAFNQMQKDATLAAAEMAGIGRVALMQEPVAAVMSVMRQRERDGTFLVFDLGGGTLDIAIAQSMRGRVSLLAHGGIEMCGGRDIDRALMDEVVKPWLVENFDLADDFAADRQFRTLTRVATWAAERAKITLSQSESAVISLSEMDTGAKDSSGEEIYLDIPLERSTLDRLMAPLLDSAIAAARDALEQAGVGPEDVDRIVFVGGPTQYKPLRDKVAFQLGISPSTDVNAMTAVAEGAAIFAESIDWSTQSRGRKSSRGSVSMKGLEFAYIARTPENSAKLVAKNVSAVGGEFQIDSLDTGWSSGRTALKDGASLDLPLAKLGENSFRVFAFDLEGNSVVIPNDKITISRTAASVDAIPASHTISIEALGGRSKTRKLQALVRKGDALPRKGKLSFRSGETLRAGSSGSLNFKLWEGDVSDPIEDNQYIGLFKVSGQDFDEGVINVGAELVCEFDISDSGNIRLDVSVPEISGSFSSGHNYYARQEAQTDYTQAAGLVQTEVERTLDRLDQLEQQVEDSRLDDIRKKVQTAANFDANSAEPEETKKALDGVREAKREISLLRKDHLKTIRQMDLDSAVSAFASGGEEFASDDEREAFASLVKTAQNSIDTNGNDFESHLDELRGRNFMALWKSEKFVIDFFHALSRSPEQFPDLEQHAQYVERGRRALATNDHQALRAVLIQMNEVRIFRSGEEEILAMTNIMSA